MSHTPEVAKMVIKLDKDRCQDTGVGFYGEMNDDGLGRMLTAAHYAEYHHNAYRKGKDPNIYNPDGSRRSRALSTLSHIEDELDNHKNYFGARLLALNTTILTYTGVRINNGFDFDIPHGYFRPKETIRINNERRNRLTQLLLRLGGLSVNK